MMKRLFKDEMMDFIEKVETNFDRYILLVTYKNLLPTLFEDFNLNIEQKVAYDRLVETFEIELKEIANTEVHKR